MATGAALNVALNLVLIPRYSIVGGALSGLLSEVLIFVLVWVAMVRSAPLSPWRPLLRPVLAAAGLAIILWALPAWPLLLTVAVGGVSYAVLVFLVGTVRLREIAEIVREQAASPGGTLVAGDQGERTGAKLLVFQLRARLPLVVRIQPRRRLHGLLVPGCSKFKRMLFRRARAGSISSRNHDARPPR